MNTDTPLPPDEPAGQNPPDGALLNYVLRAPAKLLTLEILDKAGQVVRRELDQVEWHGGGRYGFASRTRSSVGKSPLTVTVREPPLH